MTSVPFNVGLAGDGSRSSSRVLRPPGGGHTDIFGGEPEPVRGKRHVPNTQSDSSIGQPMEAAKAPEPKPVEQPAEQPAQNGQSAPKQAAAPQEKTPVSEAPAPKPQSIPEPAKVEAPKRVRVPPGGFSSGLW